MNTADTTATDIAYITGNTTADLYAATQTPRTFPKLRRTIVTNNRNEHTRALAPVYSGFITPEDKTTLCPPGYNPADMPDNFTDALTWRGKKYLTRRYLLSMFARWATIVIVSYTLSELTNGFTSPDEIHNPTDLALTGLNLIFALIGLILHFLPYIATLAYLMRIILLVAKRNLTHGAQYWLAEGNPLDPIRAWTRRNMLPLEDRALSHQTVGQTAHVILTNNHGQIITTPGIYHDFTNALTRLFYNGGYVSSAERIQLTLTHDPTIISGGVATTNTGTHTTLYVLGIRQQTLADVDYALRTKYINTALRQTTPRHPEVASARIYFEIDPELYECRINNSDTRHRFWDNIHD